jgi:O-antigen ligase
LITAPDIAAQRLGARPDARYASTHTAPLAQHILHVALFITVLSSSFVFIQPSPYEGLIALLALACLIGGVTINRKLIPLLSLLLMWNFSGCFALIPVLAEPNTPSFIAISFYLALTALLFACLFAQDSVKRLSTMHTAYILSALLTTATGFIGYFNLLPGTLDIFTIGERASATFKDPNVFGPFLILPLLLLFERNIVVGVRLRDLVCTMVLLLGLLLSFSRGAWGHFALSAALMLWLMFITSPNKQSRFRIVAFTLVVLIAGVAIFVMVIHIDSVSEMLAKRASLLQDYDVGPGGRFTIQAKSIEEILLHPNGMGPFEFARQFGLASHNTYLGTMLQYGWFGGLVYLVLTLLTLALGFRATLIRTPWQSYLIPAYATYVGLAYESLIIDTDHWRHYYLVLGIVWGLITATSNHVRLRQMSASAEYAAASRGALQ